ncbi:MAG: DJ-1/PfpI family protein, partial [Pseudobdellovibrio sp.]
MKIAIPVSAVGYHWEELMAAYIQFKKQNIEVDLFTPGGKPAVADPTTVIKTGPISLLGFGTPTSIAPDTEIGHELSEKLKSVKPVSEMRTKDYVAIYIPGGHGCLQDINRDSQLHEKILEFYRDKKILGGVCHATSTFALVQDGGAAITRGKKMTGFPDFLDAGLVSVGMVPKQFLPLPISNDQLLEKSGAQLGFFAKLWAVLWPAYYRVDAPFVTGMGPKAAKQVAVEMIKIL